MLNVDGNHDTIFFFFRTGRVWRFRERIELLDKYIIEKAKFVKKVNFNVLYLF